MRLTTVMQNQKKTMDAERGGEGVTSFSWDVTPPYQSRSVIGQDCAYYHVATLLLFMLYLFWMR